MKLIAKVVQTLPLESGTSKSGNAWSKGSIIVEYGDQYPKKVKLSNMKDAETFQSLTIGTEYEFDVEAESREYNGKWYTDLSCWKWTAKDSTATATTPKKEQSTAQTVTKPSEEEFPF